MIAVIVAALLMQTPQTDTVEVLSEATVYGECCTPRWGAWKWAVLT